MSKVSFINRELSISNYEAYKDSFETTLKIHVCTDAEGEIYIHDGDDQKLIGYIELDKESAVEIISILECWLKSYEGG